MTASSGIGSRVGVGIGVCICIWICLGAVGDAQPARDTAPDRIERARAALQAGEYQRSADILAGLLLARGSAGPSAEPNPAMATLERADQAEAWRIYGLALYFLERYEPARTAFLEQLKLDVEARLDPSLWPPEVVAFFEDVRARNAAELQQYKPRPGKRRSIALNLVPPLGQFQNGHRGKGFAIAGAGAVALLGNLGSFALLRTWCDPDTGLCESESGESREGQARVMRTVNIISGAALVGVLAYGIVDGFVYYRREPPPVSVGLSPIGGGLGVSVSGRL